jgi:NAD(P)-dependent dehydrogenase (short-subunit alcohol dehydrogenase family)
MKSQLPSQPATKEGIGRLDGMVILINGGTQGLGEQTARLCAARGAAGLVLSGRSTDLGEALAAELSGAGTPTIYVEADISKADAPAAVVAAGEAKFKTIHGLVNVAASCARGNVFDTTIEEWDEMLAINTRAPFFFLQGVAHSARRAGVGGSIVNVGSTSAHGGQTFLHTYCVSKGALSVMTRNAAYSLMRYGIRVNQVNPGWMNTASEDAVQRKWHNAQDGWLEGASVGQPMQRLVEPDEVARCIAYLLSTESGLMTGTSIDFDQSVQGAGDPPKPTAEETPK